MRNRDKVLAELMLLWSRTLEQHKLSFEEWMSRGSYAGHLGQAA